MVETTKLYITGMTCNHCVKHATKALQSVAGVEEVEVTLEPGGATVKGTPDGDDLISAVREAGYGATLK